MAEWRVVANTGDAYEVSSDGQVRSVARTVVVRNQWGASARRLPCKLLTVFAHSNGYRQVSLAGGMRYVHRLVATTFIGEQPPEHEVDHINGDRADNRVSNLRWVTKAGNQWNRAGTSAVSGERGLTYRDDRPNKPWHVRSGLNGRSKYVGVYATKEQAIAARDNFEKEHRG